VTEAVEEAPSAGTGGNGESSRNDAFISYSHHDRQFAVRLRAALEDRGQNIWLDESEIHGGSRWSDELERAIDGADTFVFLISPDSASSPECGKELEHAIELSKRILPIRVRETPLEDLPTGLTAYQLIPGRELFDSNFDQSLEQLVTEIEVDRDWVREHTDWNEKAREWQQHDRNPSYLLAGAELDLAEQFRGRSAGKQPGLSALQNEYIDASRQGATRRLRRTRAFVSVALVVAIALGFVALIQRQHAVSEQKSATSGALSADSVLELGTDPQLSLLLAAQAAKAAETPAALDALRRAIPANHLIRSFQADGSPLDGAQLSPNGTELLTESEDGYARLWNISTGQLIRTFPTLSSNSGSGGMFDRQGHEVLLWSSGRVQLWDLSSPTARPLIISNQTFGQLESAVLSPDDTMIATASGPGEDGSISIWDARTGRRLRTLAVESSAANISGAIAFSPDSQFLASGSENGTATIWNAHSGQPIHVLDVSVGAAGGLVNVFNVAFSPDGARLLVGAGLSFSTNPGGTVPPQQSQLWNVDTGRQLTYVNGTDPVWDESGQYFATTNSDGIARVWNASNGKPVSDLITSYQTTGQAIFGPEQSGQIPHVATGSAQGLGAVWNAFSGSQLATLAGDTGSLNPVAFMANGGQVLTYSSDGAARVWDIGGVTQKRISQPALPKNADPIDGGTGPTGLFAPLQAAIVGFPSSLVIVDTRTGTIVARLPAEKNFYYEDVAFDSAGHTMLVMTQRESAGKLTTLPAQLRMARGGELLRTLQGPSALATEGALSPNGEIVATVDQRDAVTTWDANSGRKLAVFSGNIQRRNGSLLPSIAVRFSPDSSLILSSDDEGRSYVWQAKTGRVLNRISGPPQPPVGMYQGPGGLISANDQLAVTYSGWDGTAHVYRVGQPRELIALRGTDTGIFDVAISPDSSLIATVAEDDVSFWDTRSESPILTIPGANFGSTIQFSPNGDSLLDGGYNFPTESLPCVVCGGFPQLLAAARARETRGFTPQERALYLSGG
jgi:WD40 repeat protein